MTNVTDEAMLQMYIDNPDFVGVEHEENFNEPREYNEEYNMELCRPWLFPWWWILFKI